jgi:hypothetical protein
MDEKRGTGRVSLSIEGYQAEERPSDCVATALSHRPRTTVNHNSSAVGSVMCFAP